MKQYDIIYVGAGPATIWSLLEVLHKCTKENLKLPKIAVLEKGKSAFERKDILFGFMGRGIFSDGKMVNHPEVGGNLSNILDYKEFANYADKVLSLLNEYSDHSPLAWVEPTPFDCKDTSLDFVQSKVCHIGTDRSLKIFRHIENIFKSYFDLYFEHTVEDIKEVDGHFQIFVKDSSDRFLANRVVVGTGPGDLLFPKLQDTFHLKTTPNKVQMGIRVEVDNSDGRFDDIIKANYDFKFVEKFPRGRVRTFCANSGAAYIAEEKNDGLFTSYNGHAFKDPKKANKKVNFGIMCEFEEGLDKKTQIQICQNINHFFPNNPYDLKDFKKFMDTVRFSAQSYSEPYDILYPKELVEYIDSFITELSQVVSLEGAKFYIPEIKLRAPVLEVDRTLQVYPNLFLAGDVVISRSIVQAGISGILVAEQLLKKDKTDNE